MIPVPSAAAVETNNGSEVKYASHSLPWPVSSPTLNVPYFDLSTYRTVDLDVAPSRDTNGFDLPLTDVTTLRFFFNLGVQYSRSLAATQLYQERFTNAGASSSSVATALSTPFNVTHIHQFASVGLMPKPIAIGTVSSDASLSPRPPPVGPTPRVLNDTTSDVNDTSSYIQARASPFPRCEYAARVENNGASQCVGSVLPQSSHEDEMSYPTQAVVGITPQSSAQTTQAGKNENMIPVSKTLFQVSEQHFSEAFNASRRKSSISSPPNAIGIATRKDCLDSRENCVAIESSSVIECVQGVSQKNTDEKPAPTPILMMTYLSNCMNNIKSTLNTNGLPVGIDANGRAVDYSSRPIDPIFQQARARMENAREFREASPPKTGAQISGNHDVEDGEIVSTVATALPTLSLTAVHSQMSHPIRAHSINSDVTHSERSNSSTNGEDSGSPPQKRLRIASGVELL